MFIQLGNGKTVTLRQIRQQSGASLGRNPSEETLNTLGYATLHTTEQPDGDVVTEGVPEQDEDGLWHQTWNVRPYTAEEAQAELDRAKDRQRRQIDDALGAALAEGLPYTMPDGTDDIIQMRAEDRSNLMGLAIEARDLQAAEVASATQELRAQSNTRYPMTPGEMIAATDAVLSHFKGLMARSWDRKDGVAAVALEDYPSAREAIAAVEAIVWCSAGLALPSSPRSDRPPPVPPGHMAGAAASRRSARA